MGFDWLPAKNYKKHYICLSCQKGFKRASEKDLKNPEPSNILELLEDFYNSKPEQDIVNFIQEVDEKLKVVCPNCRNKMLQVHYNFEVPSKNDTKSWKTLQKEMAHKLDFTHDFFMNWHQSEIKKQPLSSDRIHILKQNLAKLEIQSKN